MKLIELRRKWKKEFNQQGIDVVDVDFIISEVLGVSRTELTLIDEITEEQYRVILNVINERLNNVPVDKIFQKAYFYGLKFRVTEDVLTPRPETELLVETALKYINENNYKTVLDMCTGSGCLAISLKKNADVNITAVDISSKALTIAKQNAKQNNTEINFIKSDMFEKIEGVYDLIVSNPPYIDTDEIDGLEKEVKEHDPYIALDGGEMGLKFYNIIHNNLRKHLSENGMIILEIGEDQKELILSLYNDYNFIDCLKDLSGNDRIMIFKK